MNTNTMWSTETWLCENSVYEAAALTPDNNSLVREDRGHGPGGGVAILCNNYFKPKQIKSTKYESFECCVAELSSAPHTLRVACIYRPPQFSALVFEREFTSFLEENCLGSTPVIIVGDFNVHYDVTSNSLTRKYIELLSATCKCANSYKRSHT